MKKPRDVSPQELERVVARFAPHGAVPRHSQRTLPLERIDPLIRIAHRRAGQHLMLSERVNVDHELVLVLAGRGELRIAGESIAFKEHDVLFVRPFLPHTFAIEREVDHIAVHFDFSAYGALQQNLERRKPYSIRMPSGLDLPVKQRTSPHGVVERSLALVVEHFGKGDEQGKLRARGEFLCVLSCLFTRQARERGEPGRRRAQLERAVNLMHERISERVSNAMLARASGLGTSRLHMVFRELTGYSPIEYLRRLRVAAARELLADPALSIKEVAQRCGFSEANHFSRVFNRIDGVPPSAFREALLSVKSSRG